MNEVRTRMPSVDRKREILLSSLRVFARLGFEGATTKELAKAAGVSEALLYRHFPTKEALYQDLASLLGSSKEGVIRRLTQDEPRPAVFVRNFYFLSRMILFGPPGRPKDDSIDRLMGQSLLGDGAFAAAILDSLFVPMVPYLSRCLELARENGEVESSEATPDRLCFLFHHFLGTIALFSLPKSKLLPYDDPEVMLHEVLRFAFRGVGFTESALEKHLDFARLEREFNSLLNESQKT